MFTKTDRYILIFILVLVIIFGGISLYLLFTNKKENADQSNLLVAMAKKMHATKDNASVPVQEQSVQEELQEQDQELTDEEKLQIIAVADKLCFSQELTMEEKSFYKEFGPEIREELDKSKKMLDAVIAKFLAGGKDFTEEEQEFYNDNQVNIDTIIHDKKLFASVIHKIRTGITEFTDEELQYQQNNPKQVEKELARLKAIDDGSGSENLKGANPSTSEDDRLKLILSFFQDGIPKTITELAELYAKKTNTKVNKGNTSSLFGKIEKKGQLQYIEGPGSKKYFGLPEWFDGNKLKAKYCLPEFFKDGKLKAEFKNKVVQEKQ